MDRLIGTYHCIALAGAGDSSYLAERFEVSRAYDQQAIEDSCKGPGIPLVTPCRRKWRHINHGRIQAESTLLHLRYAGDLVKLRSLEPLSGTSRYQQNDGCSRNYTTLASNSHILIDLSSLLHKSTWRRRRMIQDAIEEDIISSLRHMRQAGRASRSSLSFGLPVGLLYVWGWCTKREDYRCQLNRMLELKVAGGAV